MTKNSAKTIVTMTVAALLVGALMLIGCGKQQAEAPAEEAAPVAVEAPVAPAAPVVEELTPVETAQVDAVYRAQAAKEINAINAEAIANTLAAEIEADIALE